MSDLFEQTGDLKTESFKANESAYLNEYMREIGAANSEIGFWGYDQKAKRNRYVLNRAGVEKWYEDGKRGMNLRGENQMASNMLVASNQSNPVDGVWQIIGDTVLRYESDNVVLNDFREAGKVMPTDIKNLAATVYAMEMEDGASTSQYGENVQFSTGEYSDHNVALLLHHIGIRFNFRDSDTAMRDRPMDAARILMNHEEKHFFNGTGSAQYQAGRIQNAKSYGFTNAPGTTAVPAYDSAVTALYANVKDNVLKPLTDLGFAEIWLYVSNANKTTYTNIEYDGRQPSTISLLLGGNLHDEMGMGLCSKVRFVQQATLASGGVVALSPDSCDIVEALSTAIIPVPAQTTAFGHDAVMVCARTVRVKPDKENKSGCVYGS